ncbi:hypothetical protein MD484_g6717, partial [Candolleomyces efflorescens]
MDNTAAEHLRTVQARAFYANYSMTMVVIGSLDMANYFQTLFESTSPLHWRQLFGEHFSEGWKYLLSYTSVGFFIAIGDALLVYRCYIVCVEYWWVTILPMLTTLSALAFTETAASAFLTVSTNILVTSFITFRLLRARQTLQRILPSADVQFYTGVIAIMIESALPLTVFGIIAAILVQLDSSPPPKSPKYYVFDYLFQCLFYAFCGLSPHMIIFRVTTGRSFTKFPSSNDGVASNAIQFARETAESSFLHSTWDRELGRTPDPEQASNTSVATHVGQKIQKGNGDPDIEKTV